MFCKNSAVRIPIPGFLVQNPDFCFKFKWFLAKWRPFVRISNSQASGWISDPIQNMDHLQNNLFSTIQNPDASRLQNTTVKGIPIVKYSTPKCPTPKPDCLKQNYLSSKTQHLFGKIHFTLLQGQFREL